MSIEEQIQYRKNYIIHYQFLIEEKKKFMYKQDKIKLETQLKICLERLKAKQVEMTDFGHEMQTLLFWSLKIEHNQSIINKLKQQQDEENN